jgi:Tol biopolymer transport system component/tRNA A-37 threonylcarbamoyl transferase component Bud32
MASDQNSFARLKSALSDRYDIEREVGSGGMATVYLAEDLKHHRRVAVKVLRPDLAEALGPERFNREIQIAAQLQHPNILPLYDSGDADGFLFYVMPYVEGQSLRDRIDREGELPIQEVVRILRDVADALTEAHAKGVVHRDIKPANIMLRGRHALVADFGVAKAVSGATGREKFTTVGVALGTPTYMAPEQASADPHLDHRVDVYALGAVAYELLTGRPVFMGTTPQMVLAAHMAEAPQPVRQRRDTVPVALEQLVMRCLEKRPADRWQNAEEMLPVLEALNTPSGGVSPTSAVQMNFKERGVRRFLWPALFVLAAGAGTSIFFSDRNEALPVVLGRADQVTAEAGLEIHPAISPDGNLVAYAAGVANQMRVFIRPVGDGRTFSVTEGTSAVQTNPRWSPDGSQILFLSEGGVHVAPALGGTSRAIVARSPDRIVMSADWSPGGDEVVFVRGDSLQVVNLSNGDGRFVGTLPALHSCAWSPAGGLIACVQGNTTYAQVTQNFGNLAPSRIVLFALGNDEQIPVTDTEFLNQSPAWSSDGRVLFFISNRQGNRDVYGVRVTDRGAVEGEPERLTLGLQAQTVHLSGRGEALVYSVYHAQANIWSLPIPVEGPTDISGASQLTSGNQVVETIRVSWDGEWILFDSNLRGNSDLYRIPMGGGAPEQLTRAPFEEFAPDLSPDGTEVAFHTFETGTRDIAILRLSGGISEVVTFTDCQESYPIWSPDGTKMAFFDQESGEFPVFLIERGRDGSWISPIQVADSLQRLEWSPDGESLAGMNPRNGLGILEISSGETRAVYEPRPGTDDPAVWLPHWSRDGRLLYFRSYDPEGAAQIWAIPASGGTPQLLVQFEDLLRPSTRPDFTVDDSLFYFTIQDRQSDIWVMEVGG